MKIVKDTLKVFAQAKILIGTAMLTFLFSGIYVFRVYGITDETAVVAQLEQALELSFYLFIVAMFVSYEYIRKFRVTGIAETQVATKHGKNRCHFLCAFGVLTMWALLVTVFLIGCVIYSYSFYKIEDPHGEYIWHIIWNLFVNIFLIMELGMLIGSLLSGIRWRIIAYLLMIGVSYLVSPYPEQMADQICRSVKAGKTSIYAFVEACNIMPLVHTGFAPSFSFGESILPYRIALILFWIMIVVTLLIFSSRKTRKCTILGVIFSILCFYVYSLPSSKLIMNSSPDNAVGHEQYYYLTEGDKTKTEDGNYQITAYKMELTIGRQLQADVVIDVDESLKEYKMTLYHGYKIESAVDEDNKELNVSQKGDYVTLTNTSGEEIHKIQLKYSGSAAAYYSNYQGIFLPGYFGYYPRAGYVPLFDDTTWSMADAFVDENTEFMVKVHTKQHLYTNLEKEGEWYKGKCDGFPRWISAKYEKNSYTKRVSPKN